MSAVTKRRHTENVEILIGKRRPQRFIGPEKKIKAICSLLVELDFKPVAGNVPWREAAKKQIQKSGEPGLMLRGLRNREGLTQVKFAKKVGIPQAHVSAMESGSRTIGKKMAQRFGKVFHIDYRVFL